MTRSIVRAVALSIALLGGARAASAQFNPASSWRQFQTRNFNIIYEAGLDSLARHAAHVAEVEHARLSAELIGAPKGRIDIIVSDNTDSSNGFATQFPDKRIGLYVRPAVDDFGLQHYDDWLRLLLTHELTHIFHLDHTGRFGRGLRAAFGRVPFTWPIFPLVGTPRFNVEGLAVLIESAHTGTGRIYGSFHEMVVRTDLLEGAFPTIDRVGGETPIWPGATRAYIYGSLFMGYITRTYGDSAHTKLIKKGAGSFLPPSWRMDGVARSALRASFSDIYEDWRAQLEARYSALADSLRRQGLTESERITTAGRYALYPRVSRDGARLAYAEENGRETVSTRVLDLASGEDTRKRRNGLGPVAWLPDGSYITAQFELLNPYELYSDLYHVRRDAEVRLTRGARAETPDASADGSRIVYVQNTPGSNRLMLKELAGDAAVVLAESSPDVQWLLPRFSPDGSRIAVQKWTRDKGHDVVVLDMQGRELKAIHTNGIDTSPAWSQDSRYVVFSSDRTGIPNLYAYDVERDALRQITNVLTGAFYPEVSRDGRSIYFSAYHTDGFHIERIAFDSASWRVPIPAAPDTVTRAALVADSTMQLSEPKKYSALRSMLPKYWLPAVWGDTALSVFLGVSTSGSDDVGRHSYHIALGYDSEHERVAGNILYSYAGLGNPVLTLEALREWDFTGDVRVINPDSSAEIFGSFEREDRLGLSMTLRRRRWRASHALTLGVEGAVFNREVLGPASFRDPKDKLVGVVAGYGFASYRAPALATSPEDGVRGNLVVRRRFELDPAIRDASYTELQASGAAYKNVGGRRFAHDVVALRVSALHRPNIGRGPSDVGGVVDFLPVRGFDGNERIGFTGWSSSLEYRMPLALIGRGYRLRPLFIDRMAATFFLDAGNASCNSEQREIYLSCPGVADNPTEALISAGFELGANVALLVFYPGWLRAGVAFPLKGGERNARFYLTAGPSF